MEKKIKEQEEKIEKEEERIKEEIKKKMEEVCSFRLRSHAMDSMWTHAWRLLL